jgi:hypothetical protein
MCLGFVRNYAGFMAVRAVLGIAEGGLLPGIVCSIISVDIVKAYLLVFRCYISPECTRDLRWHSGLAFSIPVRP